jgi:hypothetical protein
MCENILFVLLANPGVALGIIWNMTVKPGAAGAAAAVGLTRRHR